MPIITLRKGNPRIRPLQYSCIREVYFKTDRLNIEIYTDIKNIELEQQTEAVLDGHGIFYEKSEVWIESENLYEVLYQMEV